MNKKLKTILAAGLLTLGMAANACQLTAWDADVNVTAGGPGEANAYSRYSGLCSMKSDSSNAGRVINDGDGNGATSPGPGTEEQMIARFYFLVEGAGSGTIFETYTDDTEGTVVYSVTYDTTTSNVTVTPNGGGTPAVAQVGGTDWHSVEIDWSFNGGAIKLWVDSDSLEADRTTPTTPDNTGVSVANGNTVGSVALGGSGTYTSVVFDDYESRRSSLIGRLVPGDAAVPMDRTVDVGDLQSVINEILGVSLSTGMGNCNENLDVNVDVSDLQCVINIILGL